MRISRIVVSLLLLGVLSFPLGSRASASSFTMTANGTWVSNDGLLNGTWQAHFDVAGFDLSGTLNVLGMPNVADGNISGSWDLNHIGFGVLFTGQELANFTGGLQGNQLVGQFDTGQIVGNWTGALSSLQFSGDPIVPIINAVLPTLALSQGGGNLGDIVSLAATLYTLGAPIISTQHVINFNSLTAIAATAAGTPDCSVNPFIDKADTIFQFLPLGCSGNACQQVQAIVQSLTNSNLIPDGATLYTCRVKIATQAAAGIYQFIVSALSAIDIDNVPLPITSIAGQIAAKLPFLTQLKHGCHCSTVESAGPIPLPSLLAPLALILLRRRQRSRQES